MCVFRDSTSDLAGEGDLVCEISPLVSYSGEVSSVGYIQYIIIAGDSMI